MHTQGKWTVKDNGTLNKTIETKDSVIAVVYNDSNAKRIVQMHNSFDGLLEACKLALKLSQGAQVKNKSAHLLKSAIAKAEGE